jgi:hypothetical protein
MLDDYVEEEKNVWLKEELDESIGFSWQTSVLI